MHPLFELNDVDRRFFAERLAPHLPARIVDAHRHIALAEHLDPPAPGHEGNWATEVGTVESLEDAAEGYRTLLPGREVSYLAFGSPLREGHSEENNAYLAAGLAGTPNAGLAVVRPEWTPEQVVAELRRPGMIGLKPYEGLWEGHTAGADCSVFDFLTHEHLRLLDELGGWVTLHLPRRERLADPANVREVLEIRQRYPRLVMVIAHLGRSYAGRYAREGFRALEREAGLLWDTSAVLNPSVFALALDRLGPERLLFGSDFPILYMRGRRRWEGDKYVNLTSGDYRWNTHREPPEVEAGYTLYLYESLAALVDATLQLGFGAPEIEAIFHGNARDWLDTVLARKAGW